MDIIFIRELRVETTIGVHPWERESCRTLLIDLELAADIHPAAATDQLDHTVDYQAVARCISELAAASNCQLVETLAEQITEKLLHEFATPWLRLTLRKPGVPSGAQEAGVMIERSCRNFDKHS
jgi:dihydroneopterin aldolase